MLTTALDIAPVLVPATETTIVGPVPVGQEYTLASIRFTNNDTASRTLTIWNKPTGGAGTDAELEAVQLTVGALSTYDHGPLILAAGRRISALGDVASKFNASTHGWMTVQ